MVHTQYPPQNRCPAKVIHSEVGTALVFVFQESETSTLAGFLVADEIHVHRFSELGADGHDVAFGEIIWEAADVDVGRVAVVCVPGCTWWSGF